MFTVYWLAPAAKSIDHAWAIAHLREHERMADALDDLGRRLARDPLNEGESRESGVRITHEKPFGIRFVVDPATQTVAVTQAWRYH